MIAAECGKKSRRRVKGISAEACRCLARYDWPGNVRELENTIERALVLGSTELILPEDLPEAVLEKAPGTDIPVTKFYEALKEELKKGLVLKAVKAVEPAGGNYTKAVESLGIHPNNLHRLIRELDLKPGLKSESLMLLSGTCPFLA